MMELTTYTELEIAHRLGGAYSGRCLHWHGHRYEVEITVTAQKLNEDGMIVDFKKLKEVVKAVLDDKWDHGACVRADDPLARPLMEDAHHERVHVINANPTLEWMVMHWALELQGALNSECPGVAVSMLKASETARNTVTWRCNCLPWERSEPANDAKNPICAEKEKDMRLLAACRGEKDARDAAYRRRLGAALSPAPKNDWASPGATVKVDTSLPTDEMEKEAVGVEEEHYVPEEDTVLYLVQFRAGRLPYSTTVRTSLKGDALVDRCYEAAQAFVGGTMKLTPADIPVGDVVLLGITKLPG